MSLVGSLAVLGISVGLQALAHYLRPDPQEERRKGQDLQRVELPDMDEGTPIPLVYGDVVVRDLKIIWNGGTFTQKLPHSLVDGSGSGSSDLAVSHVYGGNLAVMVAIPSSPDALIRAVYLGGKRILSKASVHWGDKVSLAEDIGDKSDDPSGSDGRVTMWGGYGGGGGVWGRVLMYRGTQTSGDLTFTTSEIGTVTFGANHKGIPDGNVTNENQISAGQDTQYRDMMYLVLRNFIFGESPRIPSVSARVRSFPDALGYGRVPGADAANPAEVIWHLLADDFAGLGVSSRDSSGTLQVTDLDKPSFQAAAQTLEDEQNGANVALYSVKAGEVIAELLKQIDGVIYEDPETGKLHIKLIRNDYDTAKLMTLDPSNVVDEPERTDIKAIANEVRLNYRAQTASWDGSGLLSTDIKDEVVTVRSDASISLGRRRALDISMPWVGNAFLARDVADRELVDASTPTLTVRLTCNREAAKLRPGDVAKWSWPDYGITEMVLRVASVDWGELEDNRVIIEAIRDRYDARAAVFGN